MGACGGPLDIAGYESPLLSVPDFQRSCLALLEALHLELGEDESMEMNDLDIGVDDLKTPSANDLMDRALGELDSPPLLEDPAVETDLKSTPEPAVQAKKKKSKSRKRGGRPCDRDARASYLQLDSSKDVILAKLIEERSMRREQAFTTLHSLRGKEETEKILTKRLRSAGPLKFVTSIMEGSKALACVNKDNAEVSTSDVVISVDFHNKGNVKVQEFLVLGSQPLTALRDQLYCLTDELARKKNMVIPSGYFLIEDVFYNDMRHPEAVDYSEPIITWIRQQEEARKRTRPVTRLSKLPQFKKAIMGETLFQDLKFKLGSEYLYCHQGDCKHVLVFRDVRLAHEEDARNASAYPLLRFLPRLRHRKCSICFVFRARKVTYDDRLAPSNPCYFCDNCYYLLHYSKDGVILYEDFTVHDYHHE